MKWPHTKTDLFFIAENFAINTLATLSINDQLPVGKSAGGQWVTPCMEMLGFEPQSQQSDPGNPLYREHSWWTCGCGCTHTCTRILNALISKAQYDNARTSFIVSHTRPNTSRTGPLHDCPWLWVNKPCPHPPRPHTLPPLSAAWCPIGRLVVSILLCLCFHQHGARTTLNFPLQASTNTLLPLYCPGPSIMPLITIKSLYQQSGWHQVCQVRKIGSRPASH